MKNLFLLSIALSFLFTFSSCKKNEGPKMANGLSKFTVKVVKRIPEQGVIAWDPPLNLYNSDTIKYKVFLENILVDTILEQTSFTFNKLSGDSSYDGRVLAFTKNGDSVSATFHFEKVQQYVAFNCGDYFEVYNLYSGKRLWHYKWLSGARDEGSPTIVGDTVFFSNKYLSLGNTLRAYNLKTGKEIWGALPAYGTYGSLIYNASPVYSNGKIIVATDYGIVAFNSKSGEILWTYKLPKLRTFPIVENGKVFAGSDVVLVAIGEMNGQLNWSFAGAPCRRPLPYKNSLILGTNNGLYSLDQISGKVLWQKPFPNTSFAASGNVIIGFLDQDGLYALSPTTGATIWKESLSWLDGIGLAVTDSMCYYADGGNGKTVALKSSTGEKVWEAPTGRNAPYGIIKNQLVVAANKGFLFYDIMNGNKIGAITLSGLEYDMGPMTIHINDTTYYSIGHSNFR